MKKYLIIIISIFFSVITVKAENYKYDYVINSYNIDMVVNENNSFDIIETIEVYFNVPKHGIYRTIPIKNTVTRLDGTKSKNIARISNLKVDNNYTTTKEDGNYIIKIGNANKTITGNNKYTIKYNYNIGNDKIKNYDELYYNLIGTNWDTTISDVTFKITMPKSFDANKLGFSSGVKGLTNNNKINYTVINNTIMGNYSGTLNPYEGLTVRLELEEGYFIKEKVKISPVILGLPIIFLMISFYLWYKYGRDEKVIETIEFYPPGNVNSVELAFLYKSKVTNKDVVSLLIYLANKGYIKITETQNKKEKFIITKLKEYDGDNKNEKIFLEGLFEANKTEVTAQDLNNNFYITINKILKNINQKTNKNKILEKNSTNKKIFVILMIMITFCLTTSYSLIEYSDFEMLFPVLIFTGFSLVFIFSSIFVENTKIIIKIIYIIFGLLFACPVFIIGLLPYLLLEPCYMILYIIGILSTIGMMICLKYLPKRTAYGTDMLGKIIGFKKFLETAEKTKLEMLVTQNPTYFYDILPYTYVLGISNKWIKQFETMAIEPPEWYEGNSTFNMVNFNTFMNKTIKSAETSMTSSPNSSSGGGFSGGGSGGGGGGSW